MKNAILENLLRPLVARLGTALAAVLFTYGFESNVAEPFVNAVAAVLLLGVDLLLSRYFRKLAVMSKIIGLR
ncbi:hypothetical protein [Mesorhizobium sp. M1378]|uniref:hypothetical protein n=1 Tax=Mesorhizobium sp. M1378 TaxID=2957092 RepID=UPI00333C8704